VDVGAFGFFADGNQAAVVNGGRGLRELFHAAPCRQVLAEPCRQGGDAGAGMGMLAA
jgi:hypothetical protein